MEIMLGLSLFKVKVNGDGEDDEADDVGDYIIRGLEPEI